MNLLDQPSQKIFIADLHPKAPAVKTVKIFWIQGVVVQRSEKGDEICVDDGTGVVLVAGCDKIPAACPRVKPGQYVMVIGAMTSAGVVRAIKIQDLSGCMVAETMWMLEVVDCANMSSCI